MKRYFIETITILAASLLLASCVKSVEDGHMKSSPLTFSASVSGTLNAKGALVEGDVTNFSVEGYKTDKSTWFPITQVNTSTQSSYPNYMWITGTEYTFYGYANLPESTSVATAAVSSSGATLNYKAVPVNASDQLDIMLGLYSGDGSKTGTAAMTFHHPLASVKFKVGEITGITGITNIKVNGVYASGKTTLSTSNTSNDGVAVFTWTDRAGSKNVSQTTSVTSMAQDTPIGSPFLLIPQDLTDRKVKVVLTVEDNEFGTKTINAELSSGAFVAGKTTEVTVNYDGEHSLSFTASLAPWVNAGTDYIAEMAEPQVGPDPKYWVDMGLLSANGYPLYLSKYDVQSISNGAVSFMETLDPGPSFVAADIPDNLTFQGKSCSLMGAGVIISLFDGNYTRSLDNNNLLIIGENGNQFNIHSNTILGRNGDYIDGYDGSFKIGATNGSIKLVYEHTDAEQSHMTNASIIYISSEGNPPRYNSKNWSPVSWSGRMMGGMLETHCRSYLGITFAENKTMYFSEVPSPFVYSLSSLDGSTAPSRFSLRGTYIFNSSYDTPYPEVKVNVFHPDWAETRYVTWLPHVCFVAGTLITLADGSKKAVEELTYDDDLLVWNFDDGCYGSAKLLWITDSGLKANHYYKVTLSDGTIIKLVGSNGNCHRLFNYTDKKFEYANLITPGKEVFTEKGIVTLVSCERVDEEVEYYNLITKRHINCFAQGILAASHFNNLYPIDDEMKFVKDGRKIRPYGEFRKAFKAAGISKDWYDGVRLGEQKDSLDDVVRRLTMKEEIALPRLENEQPGFFTRIWNWIKSLFGR